MFFASDNAGPVHPQVMNRMMQDNTGHAMPYGNDPVMDEAPEAEVFLVATGTAANSLALACYTAPYATIFCSNVAHIHEDECNAPEFYAGGAKLTLVPGGDKMTPKALHATIASEETRGVHGPQRGPVSITQVTERGEVYTLDELRALTAVAREFDLPVHLDGARFANAINTLDCTPAEMTWKSGVDILSFGGTKNGCMGVEAVVLFDPDKAWEFELRRKRGAHLFSKHRYLSSQMAAYLDGDLWMETAAAANANAQRLAAGLRDKGAEFLHQPDANMIFAAFPRAAHKRLHAAGAKYYIWEGTLDGEDPDEMVAARLVCDWSISDSQIDQFLSHL